MAPMVARLLGTSMPGLVAVMVGPGSFTGLRASIALALGVGLAAGCAVVGVTAYEAFAEDKASWDGRRLWAAIDSRRGRLFLDQGDGFAAYATDAVPHTRDRVAVAGDASNLLAATLAARGTDVMLTAARLPSAYQVAMAGARRARGELPPLPAVPLYVDPPEARLPAAGLRPPPA